MDRNRSIRHSRQGGRASELQPDEADAEGEAAEQVAKLAATYDVDEVMLHPVAGAVAGTPADRAPAREETLRLLSEALA